MPRDACSRAREQVLALGVPLDTRHSSSSSSSNCIFPRNRIWKTFDDATVWDVLRCSCRTCQTDRESLEDPPEAFVDRISEHCMSLFALLVYLKHPALIVGFVRRVPVQHIESSDTYKDGEIEARYWPMYMRHHASSSRHLAADFQETKYQFFLPMLNESYQSFPEQTILPFVAQEIVGEADSHGRNRRQGYWSVVYEFHIPEYYRSAFTYGRHAKRFARKQLRPLERVKNLQRAFREEMDVLSRVRALNNQHIIQMVTAYKHGDVYNYVFPYADSILEDVLRDPRSPHNFRGPLEHHPFRIQMLGLARALQDLSDGVIYNASGEPERWFCIHFDLKPENILIIDGIWTIADFGLAQVGYKVPGSPMTKRPGPGSEEYSPPQIDSGIVDPRYDVWSLGCIFLESLAFMVAGPQGVIGREGIDQARTTTPPGSRGQDARLYQYSHGYEGTPVVKPEVLAFMDSLPRRLRHESKSWHFLRAMLDLVSRMLQPEEHTRITARGVVHAMEGILHQFDGGR